ncbi:MAG TPA: glycoside hydrolase family 18 protein [Terracidiphilus sp.]|nr:glycoside hydrolase family 18 protein [Terracidiphilus sp.]
MIAAYVFPKNGAIDPALIDVQRLTRINYAFAVLSGGHIVPSAPGDAANLAAMTALRQQKPSLQVLISVGGWLGCAGFSDAVLTPESRAIFEDSAMEFIEKYDLDGLDIDWEYPGLPGAGNRYRPEDKQNFTALIEELRGRFDAQTKKTHRRLYLTIAAGADPDYLEHTEMGRVARSLDDVNLMTYDMYEADGKTPSGNHAALYADPADPRHVSADASVRGFEAAGVPANKIVLGVPFYGHVWTDVPDVNHGLFQPGKPPVNGFGSYDIIRTTLLGHGYTRYWDEASKAPYLYNPEQRIFVSYEDPESLAFKCDYVRAHKLAGIMFWSYLDDSSGALLKAIDTGLHPAGGR